MNDVKRLSRAHVRFLLYAMNSSICAGHNSFDLRAREEKTLGVLHVGDRGREEITQSVASVALCASYTDKDDALMVEGSKM